VSSDQVSELADGGAADATVTASAATLGRRLLAALYDFPALVTLWLVGTAFLLIANRGARLDADALTASAHRAVLVGLWLVYYVGSWLRWGQTLGMKVWRIRVVRLDGSALRRRDALLRLAAALVAWLALGIGVGAAAWDPRRRTWHDRWSRTRVIATL
jgi:uncharacterized RDD family membrane protein YckC